MYSKMSNDELADFFCKGLARITKEKCKNAYSLTDFRRGILEANGLTKSIELNIHLTDLMLYALGQLEDKQQIIEDLQQIIADYEKGNNTENQESTETNEKKEEIKSTK